MTMRPYRMSKSRTEEYTSMRSYGSPRSPMTDEYEQPIQASYEDLKRPEARQKLRQQLSGTFPESTRKASQESVRNVAVPLKERFSRRVSNLEVGTMASAKSSSSTVDSIQPPKRTTTLPVMDNSTIDLEQAISLLQELKKTATPQELVALHRALLPTKETEVVASPSFSQVDDRTAPPPVPVRRRSNIPPGLATRAGFDEDLLRKPDEIVAEPSRSKLERRRSRWFRHVPSTSVSSIAALDLADDAANPLVPASSETTYTHMRGYRPGTLRITNGAASPEPSVKNLHVAESPMVADQKREEGYFTCSEECPSLDIIPGRASIDVVRSRPSVESLPIRDRILNSNKALQQRQLRARRMSGLSLTASKESLRAGTSLQIQTKNSTQSFDRESESPVSDAPTPRFHQRWSHRASQISQEYVSDCELSASPYDDKLVDKAALMNFATRLSTVYDSDPDDADEEHGTPEAALSRLTGEASKPQQTAETRKPRADSQLTALPFKVRNARPTQPQKIDSGYGSDSSFHSLRIKALQDATKTRKASEETLKNVEEHDETASVADAQSLYTFKEILQSPTLLSPALLSTTEPANGKKALSLLQLRGVKRSSLRLASGGAPASSDTVPTLASVQSSSGEPTKTQQHIAKQQKKLQKPMPASIKKQRKAEVKKLQGGSSQHLNGSDNVPSELPAAPVPVYRLSGGPPMVSLDLTEIKLGFGDDLEDLNVMSVDQQTKTIGGAQVSVPGPSPSAPTSDVSHRPRSEERRRSKSRHRSKSRGRRRDESPVRESSPDDTPEVDRSWGIARLRNKSQSRSRSQNPKRSSVEVVLKSSLALVKRSSDSERAASPGDEVMPPYSDFASVARSLGSGSYDISTNQFKRVTTPVPSAAQHQIQSPWAISTGLIKSKSVKGMNEEAASELARSKSRDVAGRDTMPEYDRPRMATPKREKPRRASSSQSNVSVEDRFPDWQRKTASANNSPQQARAPPRVFSQYAESIPPMPELPADAEVKALKADGMVAKKLRESAKSTPNTSARNSDEVNPSQKPEPLKKPVKQRKGQETKKIEDRAIALLHPVERPDLVTVQVKEMGGSSSDLSTIAPAEEIVVEEEAPLSPAHEAKHPGWVGWEQQAKLWRQRRESMGASLSKDAEEQSVITADSPPMSRQTSTATRSLHGDRAFLPSISVQRYITPLGNDNVARANNAGYRSTDAAAQHAHSYRDLIVDDKENRPAQQDVTRTDTAFSTSTTVTTSSFVTVKTWNPMDPRPAKEDVQRSESAYSSKSYQTAVSTLVRAKSPGGHVRTTSGKFVPYAPSHASIAEQSRDAALSKLTGAASASMPALGDTIRKPKNSPEALYDRFSGGLDYGWERGAGFNGSAGTRGSGSEARRKSVRMSNDYGLDLSDVPVFLQRTM